MGRETWKTASEGCAIKQVAAMSIWGLILLGSSEMVWRTPHVIILTEL